MAACNHAHPNARCANLSKCQRLCKVRRCSHVVAIAVRIIAVKIVFAQLVAIINIILVIRIRKGVDIASLIVLRLVTLIAGLLGADVTGVGLVAPRRS